METLLLWLALLAAEPEAGAAAPSPALLEFLGRFEDADGNWVDPLTLADPLPEAAIPDDMATATQPDEEDDESDAKNGDAAGPDAGRGGVR